MLEAFNNLPEAKQGLIEKCAFEEFSKNPYEKVSIFQIAKNSGISRASFYCYFVDKEDIYKYLVLKFLSPIFNKITKNPPPYDIFKLNKAFFEFLISFKGTDKQLFLERLMQNMKPKTHEMLFKPFKRFGHNMVCKEQYVDLTEDDFVVVRFMILSVMATNIIRYFSKKTTLSETIKSYEKAINIIKYGLIKGNKNDRS